jgi:hypothetical protein
MPQPVRLGLPGIAWPAPSRHTHTVQRAPAINFAGTLITAPAYTKPILATTCGAGALSRIGPNVLPDRRICTTYS